MIDAYLDGGGGNADGGGDIAGSFNRDRFAYDLLKDRRKARVYTAVLTEGPVTRDRVTELIDGVGETTVYEVLRELSETEYVDVDDRTEPYEYTANPIRTYVVNGEGEQTVFEVTPTFIAVVSASAVRDDIDLFIDRHSLGMLAAAYQATLAHLNGEMSRRMAADQLDLDPYEGITITNAIETVVDEMRGHDPLLDEQLVDGEA